MVTMSEPAVQTYATPMEAQALLRPNDQSSTLVPPANPAELYAYLSSPVTSTHVPEISPSRISWESQNHVPRRTSTLPLIPEATSVSEAHNQTAIPPFVSTGPDVSYPSFAPAAATCIGHTSPWSTASQNLLTPQYPFFPAITTPCQSSPVSGTNLDPSHQWRITRHEVNATSSIAPQLPQFPQQTQSDMLAVQHLVIPNPQFKSETLIPSDRDQTPFDHLAHFRIPIDQTSCANSITPYTAATEQSISMSAGAGSSRDAETIMNAGVTWRHGQYAPISDRVSANSHLPHMLPQTHTARPLYAHKSSPTKRGRRTSNASSTAPLRKKRPPQLHLPPPMTNMHLPIPPSLHSAPAAPISLDLLTSAGTSVATVIPVQQPPKVEGWIKPEDRPVPPIGYTQPALTSVAPLERHTGSSTGVPATSTRSRAIPRTWSAPQLHASHSDIQSEYIVTPGLNGLRVVPWRPASGGSDWDQPAQWCQRQPAGDELHFEQLSSVRHLQPHPPPAYPSYSSRSREEQSHNESGISSSSLPPLAPFSSKPLSNQPSSPDQAIASIGSSLGDVSLLPAAELRPKPARRRPSASKGSDEESKDRAVCEVCEVVLSRHSDLQRHMRKHSKYGRCRSA